MGTQSWPDVLSAIRTVSIFFSCVGTVLTPVDKAIVLHTKSV